VDEELSQPEEAVDGCEQKRWRRRRAEGVREALIDGGPAGGMQSEAEGETEARCPTKNYPEI